MQVYQIQTTIGHNGMPVLGKLPFAEGEQVEVIIKPAKQAGKSKRKFPFRGKPFKYIDPFDPVFPESDWNAMKDDPA
jgi:hypothetical protein